MIIKDMLSISWRFSCNEKLKDKSCLNFDPDRKTLQRWPRSKLKSVTKSDPIYAASCRQLKMSPRNIFSVPMHPPLNQVNKKRITMNMQKLKHLLLTSWTNTLSFFRSRIPCRISVNIPIGKSLRFNGQFLLFADESIEEGIRTAKYEESEIRTHPESS